MATAHLPILCRQAEKEAMINNNTKINSMKKNYDSYCIKINPFLTYIHLLSQSAVSTSPPTK